MIDFWLGTHKVAQHWWDHSVPLFVSRRTLQERKTLPRARCEWALDSGGFTELKEYGEWRISEEEYVACVHRFQREIGHLAWVAPMDWMCEPFMLKKTRLTVYEHQEFTVRNFLALREELGELVIPVLQGWTLGEYLACWDEYSEQGVDLEREKLVGLGSVCRRQDTASAAKIVRRLSDEGLRLHGFGIKVTGLGSYGDVLASADSMAWSYRARHAFPLPGCTHAKCNNCVRFAMRWRDRIVNELMGQTRLEVA